jgi:glucose-6-phosphate 1-dehydrogenase
VYLDQVLDEFIKEMDVAKNQGLLQVARRIRDTPDMASYSPDFLNAANHNPDLFAVGKDVEAAWDQMEPLLRYVLNPAKPNEPGNP